MSRTATLIRGALCAAAGAFAANAAAQIAVSANDNKVRLDNGNTVVVANPPPDTATLIDLGASPPKVLAELNVPASVVGPPFSVAIAPDKSIALVTAAMKVDPNDATKTIPDNKLSVIDLTLSPPAVIATLEAGAGAAGVSVNRAGTLALVANRNEGTVSVFTISGKTVTAAGKVKLGDEKSGPCHAVFTPDGKAALVTRDGDNTLTMLAIDGSKVEAKRDFFAGLRPYGADIAADGAHAVVANIGRGVGDADTVSVIDLKANPVHVVETITVGHTPEGLRLSPDGKVLAVLTHNGSAKAPQSPLYHEHGILALYHLKGAHLTKFAEAPIGKWSQGIAFSRDGKTIVVQNMVERELQVFRLEGGKLRDTKQPIKVNGGPAGIATGS